MNGFYVQNKLERLMDRVERNYLRPCQIQSFECSAACIRESHFSRHEVEICLRACSHPYEETSHLVERRIFQLQDSLRGCASECADIVRQEELHDAELAHDQVKQCRNKCVDKFVEGLPRFEQSLGEELSQSSSYMQCVMSSATRYSHTRE